MLLEWVGVVDNVCEVVLVGVDEGQMDDFVKLFGYIYYLCSLLLSKVLDNVLFVYEMNGEVLIFVYGVLLWVIVFGWYGMVVVKWLIEICVIDYVYQGYFQMVDYVCWERQDGLLLVWVLFLEMCVKLQIFMFVLYVCVQVGEEFEFCGVVWMGGECIVQWVEVSIDGGQSWQDVEWQ